MIACYGLGINDDEALAAVAGDKDQTCLSSPIRT